MRKISFPNNSHFCQAFFSYLNCRVMHLNFLFTFFGLMIFFAPFLGFPVVITLWWCEPKWNDGKKYREMSAQFWYTFEWMSSVSIVKNARDGKQKDQVNLEDGKKWREKKYPTKNDLKWKNKMELNDMN